MSNIIKALAAEWEKISQSGVVDIDLVDHKVILKEPFLATLDVIALFNEHIIKILKVKIVKGL